MCMSANESIFEPKDGSIRTLCINFAICPWCGEYLNGKSFVGEATNNYRNGKNGLIERNFIILSGSVCGCNDSAWVYDKDSAIPVSIANRMSVGQMQMVE